MAEHAYEPGMDVAVRAEADATDRHGDVTVYTHGRHCAPIRVTSDRLAPWLSVDEQDSLLRVVKAAMGMQAERDRYMAHSQLDAAEGYNAALAELRAAMGALSPEILSRVAHLSEEG